MTQRVPAVMALTQHPGAGSVLRLQSDKNADFIHVADFGAEGNGINNDGPEIMSALAAGAVRGLPVFFDGTKTYNIAANVWSIPAGSIVCTNGATFRCTPTTSGNEVWLTVNANTRIDQLKVSIPTGVRRDRAIMLTGDNIRIDTIALTSTDQQANNESDDGGVQILTATRVAIGIIMVAKYDRSIVLKTTTSCSIGRVDIMNYVRGVWAVDNIGLVIGAGHIRVVSPNANASAGDNGMLFSCTVPRAQRDVSISNVVIEDASEHGIRVGGPAKQSIKFTNCSVFNIGGSGLKVLGTDAGNPLDTNYNIIIAGFIVEDVGLNVALSPAGRAGVNVGFSNGVQISGLVVRKRAAAWAAQYGVVIRACTNVVVDAPLITECELDGIYFDGSQDDNTVVNVYGGFSRANGRHGLYILTGATQTTRRAYVDGTALEANIGMGFKVEVIVGGGFVANMIRAKVYSNTGGMGASNNNAGTTLEISGDVGATPIAGILARNGSWIDDTVTLNIRKAGAWVAL